MSALFASLLIALNLARATQGLQPVQVAPILTQAAQTHSAFLARSGVFQHNLGRTPWKVWVKRYTKRCVARENIAWTSWAASPAQVVTMWLHSPRHRRNIMSHVTRVGYAQSFGKGRYYEVLELEFCS